MIDDMNKSSSELKSSFPAQSREDAAKTILVVKPPGAPPASKPLCIEMPQSAKQRPKDEALAAFMDGPTHRFNITLFQQTLGTVWLQSGGPQEQIIGALADAMAVFEPRDPVEGMLASLAVAHHSMAMECLRRAMLPTQPDEAASRLRQDAVRSTRAMAEMAEAIDRRRGKGQQTVRVEHVTVQAGGQAIVGQVTPSRRTRGRGE